MHDTYQGRTNTISPAFGKYYVDHFVDIDRSMGVTGPTAAGVTGSGTLVQWNWDQTVTGPFTTNNTV